MTIPYTFAGATTAIPLAQLDANFASPITLGNVAMTLSNTYTSIGNLTLNNVTINSGTINSAVSHTYGNANAVVFTNSSNVATTNTALTFDGNNLGIGTSSPASVGGGQTELTVKATGTDKYAILNLIGVRDVGGNQNGTIGFWNNFGTLTRTAAIIGQNTASSDTAGELAFLTKTSAGSLTEAMRIDSSGNVGINTTNPDYGSYGATEKILGVTGVAGNRGRLSLQNTSTGTTGVAGTIAFFNGSTLLSSIDVVANGAVNTGRYTFNINNAGSVVEALRINPTGTIVLQSGNVNSNGTGISFPATQNASSDVNTLDDYEEGTWTPSWTGGITSSGATYTKIGRVVYVSAQITATGATSGDLSGLPFGSVIDGSDCGSVGFQSVNVSTWNVLKVASTTFRFYAGGTQQQFTASGNNARFAFSYITST